MPLDEPAPPRILVIDDAATYRRYFCEIVETLGATVHAVNDGIVGIEQAIQDHFALALIDVNMPGLNGYQVVEALRQDPHTRSLPIIMISSESKDCDRTTAFRVGANLYLVKPVDPDRLCNYVRLILGNRGE